MDPLSHRVAVSPEATALVDADREETWTVADLDAAVDAAAGRLAACGVEAGDHLGVVLPTRPAAAVVVHAALRLGAAIVPGDPRATPAELRRNLDLADATTVVCDADTETLVADAVGSALPALSVDAADHGAVQGLDSVASDPVTPHEWSLDATALVPFTSGTTGSPKAVVLTAGNLLASAATSALRLGLHRDETWHVALPVHHVGGLTPLLRAPLYGMSVVLRESFDAAAVAADFEAHDVTATSMVPTTLDRLLDATDAIAPSLRAVLLGGAPAGESLVERCRAREVPVYPTYGMTETASQIVTATPEEAFADPGTVGRPLFGSRVTVRDESGAERPAGEAGELVVAGPTVSPGYYGDPEATAEAFGPHGLRTGDVGVRDEAGRIRVYGRLDDRIVTGGENVDPSEVAAALRDHPGVADAAVVGLPDEEWGERVAALVVGDATADELDAHCRDRLAGYKVPKTVRFADELPRTASGTVERDAVRERLRE